MYGLEYVIPYRLKGAASALYSTDRTWKITECKNGDYSTWAPKVNVGNGVLQACYVRSHLTG